MTDHLELAIDELLLDEENPRLGTAATQSEALEKVIQLNSSHFRTLMTSIRDNGLDPGDSLYVIEADNPKDYIVLEGNRRLSAMKVLTNPDLLKGTNLSESVRKAIAKQSVGHGARARIEPVRCVLFDDRNAAHDWIYRRHAGAVDGEGRMTWGTLEIQRFTGDRSLLDVLDFVGRNASYTSEEWASIRKAIESRKATNLARLLDSSAGKNHLGIQMQDVDGDVRPCLIADPEWALLVLTRIIEDVRDGKVNSRTLNTASDIAGYFDSLPGELQPGEATNGGESKPLAEINLRGSGQPPAATKNQPSKRARTPRPRRKLAPKTHAFKPPASEKGRKLLREAAGIDAQSHTIAAAFVLRAFVEAAVNEYMANNNMSNITQGRKGNTHERSLTQRATAVAEHIQKNKVATKKDLHGFRVNILGGQSPTSIESLHGFVHNDYQLPKAEDLTTAWEASIPVFIAAFGAADAK